MGPDALARLTVAVELNPDRRRVTLRRDDVRAMLADHQRQASDVEHYKTGAVRLEAMCAERCATVARLTHECAEQRAIAARGRVTAEDLHARMVDFAWVWPRAWMLYVATAFAGFMAHG